MTSGTCHLTRKAVNVTVSVNASVHKKNMQKLAKDFFNSSTSFRRVNAMNRMLEINLDHDIETLSRIKERACLAINQNKMILSKRMCELFDLKLKSQFSLTDGNRARRTKHFTTSQPNLKETAMYPCWCNQHNRRRRRNLTQLYQNESSDGWRLHQKTRNDITLTDKSSDSSEHLLPNIFK